MSELVRFGVAMDKKLLAQFDERIAQRGYENRSEALRDLVRADLTRAAFDAGALVAGTLTVVATRKHRPDVTRILDEADALVATSCSLTLDAERVLELVAVRGPAGRLNELSGKLGGLRGVLSSELCIAAAEL